MTSSIFLNNTARNSDVDRNLIESLDDAEAVLHQYLDDDMRPHSIVSMQAMAEARALAHPRLNHLNPKDVVLTFKRVQGALKELCVDELTRLDRVHLDLTGELDVPAWQSTEVPAIVFCALRSTDSMYREDAQEALAVYFDPALVAERFSKAKSGAVYSKPDVYDARGYVTVVRSFASMEAAEDAKADLEQALRVVRAPVTDTALAEDDVRSVGLDDDDNLSYVDLDSF